MAHLSSVGPLKLDSKGRVVLPVEVREQLNWQPGERLVATVKNGEVHLVSAREVAERCAGLWKHLAPGRSLVDELIAERRLEAQREDEE